MPWLLHRVTSEWTYRSNHWKTVEYSWHKTGNVPHGQNTNTGNLRTQTLATWYMGRTWTLAIWHGQNMNTGNTTHGQNMNTGNFRTQTMAIWHMSRTQTLAIWHMGRTQTELLVTRTSRLITLVLINFWNAKEISDLSTWVLPILQHKSWGKMNMTNPPYWELHLGMLIKKNYNNKNPTNYYSPNGKDGEG